MEFNINRRLLTKDEKIRRAIFFYTYDMPNFEVEYVNGHYEEDEFNQPLVDIDKNINKLDETTKALIYEFAEREIYDETIDLKCLSCDYQELNVDWEQVDELWNGKEYPKLYCPDCGKLKFVPIDIWNKKNKYKK
jgi:hypothetical protein